MIHDWNEDMLYTNQNMSMIIRTGPFPLSKKNFNKPLSQGGYQSRTKLETLIEVRYLKCHGDARELCWPGYSWRMSNRIDICQKMMRMRALLNRSRIKGIADRRRREAEEKELP